MFNGTKNFTIGYIYRIQNKTNGKVYIGQTVHPKIRPFNHLNHPDKTNKRLGSAIKSHGKDNFTVTILTECYSRKDLDWAELFYIVEWYDSTHNSRGYNFRTEEPGQNYIHSMTVDEHIAHCAKMKVVQNDKLTNIKRGFSISKTKQTSEWKSKMKEYNSRPEVKAMRSRVQKLSRQKPEVKLALSLGQKKGWKNNFKRKAAAGDKARRIWGNHSDEKKEQIRNQSRQNMITFVHTPEARAKQKETMKSVRQTEEYKVKFKTSHNTDSCKQKVREAQIHPIRKFIEEYWFVIKEKFPDGFSLYGFMNRFGFDTQDMGFRQAVQVGFKRLSNEGIIVDNGFESLSAKIRSKKYVWN